MSDAERDAYYADFSKELIEARRAMRKELLRIGDTNLRELYYKALMLSEHEVRRSALLEARAESDPTFSPDQA